MVVLYEFSFLSIFVILGIIVKNKFKIFNKFFIPSSIIGGFIGLVIGPEILGRILESNSLNYFSFYEKIKYLPGILIIPLTASIPIGLTINKETKNIKSTIKTALILFLVTFTQIMIGYILNILFTLVKKGSVYKTFGSELNAGFAGGHGIAGLIGFITKDLGIEYWNISQGVASSMATLGLIFGIVMGIILINKEKRNKNKKDFISSQKLEKRLEKKEKIVYINSKEQIPQNRLVIYLALVFAVCGLAILIVNILRKYNVFILSKISYWSLAMIIMFIVCYIFKNFIARNNIDAEFRNMVSGFFIEYAVVSAIMTLPIRAVIKYTVPILVLAVVGLFLTWFLIKFLCYKCFNDENNFGRAIALLGTSTGIFITGLLLIKAYDEEMDEEILKDYSLGFSIVAFLGPIFNLIPISIELSYHYGPIYPVYLMSALIVITIILLKHYSKN